MKYRTMAALSKTLLQMAAELDRAAAAAAEADDLPFTQITNSLQDRADRTLADLAVMLRQTELMTQVAADVTAQQTTEAQAERAALISAHQDRLRQVATLWLEKAQAWLEQADAMQHRRPDMIPFLTARIRQAWHILIALNDRSLELEAEYRPLFQALSDTERAIAYEVMQDFGAWRLAIGRALASIRDTDTEAQALLNDDQAEAYSAELETLAQMAPARLIVAGLETLAPEQGA